MKVLVDTSIWSYALRSPKLEFIDKVNTLKNLINDQRTMILGVIKQELLSGYRDKNKFNKLVNKLKPFNNIPILEQDYIQAAEFSSTCRSKGVQGSPIDFLICAVAHRLDITIFTTDKDFTHYQKHIPINLL